jgi:peptidoglycan/xylan/chitin deacetylase (PgdA/CDA1 family)
MTGRHDRTAERGVALRMDDVGASTKWWEMYARPLPLPGRAARLGDFLFLKAVPPLRAWGPYRELRATEWTRILALLRSEGALLTVGVTAAWVTWSGELVPFPMRFPAQARLIREGVEEGLIEVANHGLTHCVIAGRAFRPKLLSGNRSAHREFWESIPYERQLEHLTRSQEILTSWLSRPVMTFVPPGNVFTDATVRAAASVGIRVISCRTEPRTLAGVTIVGDRGVVPFHDRDLVFRGTEHLARLIATQKRQGRPFRLVGEFLGRPE